MSVTHVESALGSWPSPASDTNTFGKPAGLTDYDAMVVALLCEDEARTMASAPAGWTLEIEAATGIGRVWVYSKAIALEASEPGNYAFQLDAAPAAGNEFLGTISTYRGVDVDDVIDGAPRWVAIPGDSRHVPPDAPARILDGLRVGQCFGDSVSSYTPPAGMAEVLDTTQQVSTGAGLTVGIATEQLAAEGQVGEKLMELAAAAKDGVGLTYVLRPLSPIDPAVSIRDVARTDAAAPDWALEVAMPASQPGDLLYAILALAEGTLTAFNAAADVPEGWELVATVTGTDSVPTRYSMGIYAKVAGAEEPSSYTWRTTQQRQMSAIVYAFRHAVGVGANAGEGTTSAAVTLHPVPVVSPAAAHGLIVCAWQTEGAGAQTQPDAVEDSGASGAGAGLYLGSAWVPKAAATAADAFEATTGPAAISTRHAAAIAPRLITPPTAEVRA